MSFKKLLRLSSGTHSSGSEATTLVFAERSNGNVKVEGQGTEGQGTEHRSKA